MPVMKIKPNQFNDLIAGEPILIDFFASWCGPCQMLSPILEEIADEKAGNLAIGKLNIDEATDIANRYGVMAVPTLLLFKDGEAVSKIVGYREKDELLAWIHETL